MMVSPIRIEDELRHSYLDYAMSVIIDRALSFVCRSYVQEPLFKDFKSLTIYSFNYYFSIAYISLHQVSVVMQTSALMWASLSHFNSRL